MVVKSLINRFRRLYNRIAHRQQFEAILKSANFTEDKLDVIYEHPAFAILTDQLVKLFNAYKGVNYIEMKVFDPTTMRQYAVTLRPTDGKTPHDLKLEAQQKADQYRRILHATTSLRDWMGAGYSIDEYNAFRGECADLISEEGQSHE